jgi:hypothetical protein
MFDYLSQLWPSAAPPIDESTHSLNAADLEGGLNSGEQQSALSPYLTNISTLFNSRIFSATLDSQLSTSKSGDPEQSEKLEIREKFIPHIARSLIKQSLRDSPERMIAIIALEGTQLTEIQLSCANDLLLLAISRHCPQLHTLHLSSHPGPSSASCWRDFSDEGIGQIGKLSSLQNLSICLPDELRLSSNALQELFSNGCWRGTLQSLSISHRLLDDRLLASIGKLPNLQEISLLNGSYTPQGLLHWLANFASSKLSIFSIKSSLPWNEQNFSHLTALLNVQAMLKSVSIAIARPPQVAMDFQQWLPSMVLTSLSLEKMSIDDEFCKLLCRCSNVKKLSIGSCAHITGMGYKLLLVGLQKLRFLALRSAVQLTDSSGLYSKIAELPYLHTLQLEGLAWADRSFELLCTAPQIRSFSLQNCPRLATSGLMAIAKLSKLRRLHISNCRWFNGEALQALSDGAAQRGLTHLFLYNLPIDDNSPLRIGDFSSLEHLAIGGCCSWAAATYRQLLMQPRLAKQLKTLYLIEMPIEDSQIKELQLFNQLRGLYLGDCSIADEQFLQLWEEASHRRRAFGCSTQLDELEEQFLHESGWYQ